METVAHSSFWTGKHVATNVILVILAFVAAYLQFDVYPRIMSATGGYGFGEKDVALKLSFLTFQYTATRCTYTSCVTQIGVPAFDFFQAIILVVVITNLVHFYYTKKQQSSTGA